MQQWQGHAEYYHEQAGRGVAEEFITAVEKALQFIGQSPYACASYETGSEDLDLQHYRFRKWNISGFPHKIIFRIEENTILVEVIYAHKMNVASRLTTDIQTSNNDKSEN